MRSRTTWRRDRGPAACLSLAAWLFSGSALSFAQETGPTFGETVEVRIVEIEVEVTDRAGRPIPGLAVEDFSLRVDGQPVPIQSFVAAAGSAAPPGPPPETNPTAAVRAEPADVAARAPLQMVILVDEVYLDPAARRRALQQVQEAVLGLLMDEDRVMLAVSNRRGLEVRREWTSDRESVRQAFAALERAPADGLSRAVSYRNTMSTLRSIFEHEGCAGPLGPLVRAQATEERNDARAALDRMRELLRLLASVPGGKVLFWISQGPPQRPGEDLVALTTDWCGGSIGGSGGAGLDGLEFDITADLERVGAAANEARVTVQSLEAAGLRLLPGASAEMTGNWLSPATAGIQAANTQNTLHQIAWQTGGRAALDGNDLRPAVVAATERRGASYSLAFESPFAGDGKTHRVEVRSTVAGAVLRHRRSYADRRAQADVASLLRATATLGVAENDLGLAMRLARPIEPLAKGRHRVALQLAIAAREPAVGTALDSRRFRLWLVVRDPMGNWSPLRETSAAFRRHSGPGGPEWVFPVELVVGSGRSQISVAAQDPASAALGLARLDTESPGR